MGSPFSSFGISHRVMNAGMGHIATPALAAAVANAGGLGMLATSTLTPAQVGAAVDETRRFTDRPFGANITLAYPHAAEIAEVLLDKQVHVLNLSMGSAPALVGRAHALGISVFASVTTVRHARRAERDGVDALVATGHEAAGHGSELTTLVLVDRLFDEIRIPIIAAGGVCDARSVSALRALGAAGVSLGTRFALSAESPVHSSTRVALLATDADGTLVTDRLDGFPSRVLAAGRALAIAAGDDDLGETRLSITHGLLDRGVVACGQIVGRIREIRTCREIIDSLSDGSSDL